MQVRAAGLPEGVGAGDAVGQGNLDPSTLGQMIVHYTYDGLGRLIRAQRPEAPDESHPDPDLRDVPTTLHITDYFHDGVRVVQEVSRLGEPMREVITGLGTPEARTHRLARESTWTSGSGGSGGLPDLKSSDSLASGPLSSVPGSAWALTREYVHAADPGAYVDEVLAQLVYADANGYPTPEPVVLYTLRDTNYNVVALADEFGRLAAQYTYGPYGDVRSAQLLANPSTGPPATLVDKSDTHWEDLFGTGSSSGANSTGAGSYWSRILAAARSNRLGHQGLMAERMDWKTQGSPGSWADPLGSETTQPWDLSDPPPTSGAQGVLGGRVLAGHEVLYHSRGRMYAPTLGRFTSADPNATGVPVLSSLAFGGAALSAGDTSPDWLRHYGDGMNVHAAYGGNPLARSDPGGLFWDSPSDWWEDTKTGAEMAWNGYQTFQSFTDVHGLVQGMAEELVGQYSDNMEWDLEWALDWSASDTAHTRGDSKWVNMALAYGAYKHFGFDYWGEVASDMSGPAMAMDATGIAKQVVSGASHISNRARRVFKKFSLELAGKPDQSDKGKSLTQAGASLAKHTDALRAIGLTSASFRGNVANQNKLGYEVVRKIVQTGRVSRYSQYKIQFLDLSTGKKVHLSPSPEGKPYRVDIRD